MVVGITKWGAKKGKTKNEKRAGRVYYVYFYYGPVIQTVCPDLVILRESGAI